MNYVEIVLLRNSWFIASWTINLSLNFIWAIWNSYLQLNCKIIRIINYLNLIFMVLVILNWWSCIILIIRRKILLVMIWEYFMVVIKTSFLINVHKIYHIIFFLLVHFFLLSHSHLICSIILVIHFKPTYFKYFIFWLFFLHFIYFIYFIY